MTPGSPTSVPDEGSFESARGRKVYRIFLSSPSDVNPERDAVERVVKRINAELGHDARFDLIRWEHEFYTASSSFQKQIARPSECDIVVCIFWKRLGTDLPDEYRRSDGSLPTGSEYEFEDAVRQAAESPQKIPDVLVYRKEAEVLFSEATLELEKAQRDRFLGFWQRWFRNEKGQFVAGFHSFDTTSAFEAMFEAHLRKWLKDLAGEVTWTEGCPFRGLKPFDVEHAPIFFGRRRESERIRARFLANALSSIHFLLIVGPSGSGKSSLVRAGLIPRLKTVGGLDGLPRMMRYTILSPAAMTGDGQADWTLELSKALFSAGAVGVELEHSDFNTPEQLAPLLRKGGPEAVVPLRRALERAAGEHSQPTGLLLVIDQLEEIFAWPNASAEAFISCVATLSSAAIYIVATMRSEFQHRLNEITALANLAGLYELRGPNELDRVLDVGSPGPADIREMIVEPARAAGLTFEGPLGKRPDLAKRIEDDSTPETLPALQFLLTQLYERREGKMLTHRAYDDLGGVTGVLTAAGEAVLAKLGPAGEPAFANLARSLIGTSSGDIPAVARRIRTDLFAPESGERKLALALRDAGLLVSDHDSFRLAHETLITRWGRLAALVANRRLFDIRERLLLDYRRYLSVPATDRALRRKHLLRGLALEEARELIAQWGRTVVDAPLPGLADFITASVRADRLRRGGQLMAAGAVSAVVVIAALTALSFRSESIKAKRDAEVRLELARAETALRSHDRDRALDIAIGLRGLADTLETRSMALTAMLENSSPQLHARLSGPAIAARFAADGALVTLSRTGVLNFTRNGSPRRVKLIVPTGSAAAYFDFVVLPDDGIVALMSDGRVGVVGAQHIKNASEGLEPTSVAEPGYILSLAGQADMFVGGTLLRVAMTDGSSKSGRLLNCDLSGLVCKVLDLPPALRAVAFSPSGDQLAIAGDTWVDVLGADAPIPKKMSPLDDLRQDSSRSLGWSADGAMLTLGTQYGRLISFKATTSSLEPVSRKELSGVSERGASRHPFASATELDLRGEFSVAVKL